MPQKNVPVTEKFLSEKGVSVTEIVTEIIFCERKKLKVKDFTLFVVNSGEKIYELSQKISEIQR